MRYSRESIRDTYDRAVGGDASAQFEMAYIYANGAEGVINPDNSLKDTWLHIAAHNGSKREEFQAAIAFWEAVVEMSPKEQSIVAAQLANRYHLGVNYTLDENVRYVYRYEGGATHVFTAQEALRQGRLTVSADMEFPIPEFTDGGLQVNASSEKVQINDNPKILSDAANENGREDDLRQNKGNAK